MADGLTRYAAARDAVAALLDDAAALLRDDARWPGAAGDVAQLRETAERLRGGRFVLGVVGEFSSGKSFLLNALLGRIGLLATDINPSTATITELSYAPEDVATAVYESGRSERVPLDGLARFVAVAEEAGLHDAMDEARDVPVLVRVGVASPFLRNGFVVADTPGLASINPAHRRATLSYLPGADAVLYLIDTQQPFTDGDAAFLGIIRRYIESIFIVQTKIDLWRMNGADGRAAWQTAAARIVAQTALHAPGTPVFPLSAREYAEGLRAGDDALIAQSGLVTFTTALDATLVATTGRSRLRRAAAEARRVATRATDALAREAAALDADPATLGAQRRALEPALDALAVAAAAGRSALLQTGAELRAEIVARGTAMREALHRTLARSFDVADVARLRDRAKLHVLVDETLAASIGDFAGTIAGLLATRLRAGAEAAMAPIGSGERLPVAEDAAHAFGADPASGAWSVDVETGLRATIVLGALGGPAVSLVTAVSERFRSRPAGDYMKRELLADLNAGLSAAFDRDVARFVDDIGERAAGIAGLLAARIAELARGVRDEALGAIDRARETHAAGDDPAARAGAMRERALQIDRLATQIETQTERFAHESRDERPGVPSAIAASRHDAAGPAEARFDPRTYEHGLRPERWRVAVIGAFKRGKSGLINALAGARVLPDEDAGAELHFPVHIRYGPAARTYALSDAAEWVEIPADAMLDAALRTPLLIETPWDLPRELVLVHAPPFDAGFSLAEDVVSAAAAGASEILALFSRQLSERELDLYARLAGLGKPMTFLHTLADHETPDERRTVVALADRYLRQRGITPQRIFTVSTRTRAAWNELGALRATLVTHAEEHMERRARAERERRLHDRLGSAAGAARTPPPRRSFLDRLWGKR